MAFEGIWSITEPSLAQRGQQLDHGGKSGLAWAHHSKESFQVHWGNFAQLNEKSQQSCGAE